LFQGAGSEVNQVGFISLDHAGVQVFPFEGEGPAALAGANAFFPIKSHCFFFARSDRGRAGERTGEGVKSE